MEKRIKDALTQFTDKTGAEIINACETGSRSWGLSAIDSDYDVRVLYKFDPEYYLRVDTFSNSLLSKVDELGAEGGGIYYDTLNWMSEDRLLDIVGFDVKKFLGLLARSNAGVLEQIQVGTVYVENTEVMEDLRELSKKYFSKKPLVHHYKGMGSKAFAATGFDVDGQEPIPNKEYPIKKLVYAFKCALNANFVATYGEIPPIDIRELMYSGDLFPNESLRKHAEDIFSIRSSNPERFMHKGDTSFVEEVRRLLKDKTAIKDTESTTFIGYGAINEFFRKHVIRL